jgi:diguanylate cyclase (GGDEF)-like protein
VSERGAGRSGGETFVILTARAGKARLERFGLELRGEIECPLDSLDFARALRRWRPDLVAVTDDEAERVLGEIRRSGNKEAVLLLAPMPEGPEESFPTTIGLAIPPGLGVVEPKELVTRLLRAMLLNPLTRLLGNWALQAEIERRLEGAIKFGLLWLDIDNFKAYNDVYGFAKGDQVLLMLSEKVVEATRAGGTPEDRCAHIGGDDFAVLTSPETMEPVAHELMRRFEREVPSAYSEQHRREGGITVVSRTGEPTRYPLMTLSIAGVSNRHRRIGSYLELSEIAAEVKAYAKSSEGNVYAEDRRTGEESTPPHVSRGPAEIS